MVSLQVREAAVVKGLAAKVAASYLVLVGAGGCAKTVFAKAIVTVGARGAVPGSPEVGGTRDVGDGWVGGDVGGVAVALEAKGGAVGDG